MAKKKVDEPINVGISTCLLGQKVRFDGGHKRDRLITDILGEYFRFLPVCPELEVGMGVPREAVRLEGSPEAPRMIGNKTGEDWTDRMNSYSRKRVRERDIGELSGYILKNRSPSCGMERVKLYITDKNVQRVTSGLYAKALMEQYPLMPIEEEGRLHDVPLRENFIVRVFAYHRLQQLYRERFSRGRMVAFHTAHKYLMLAHSPKHYTEMGRLVAAIKKLTPADFRDRYRRMFMEGLAVKTTARKNVNVLMHILGFLKKQLTPDEKQDILAAIDDYHREFVPLVVPLTLVRHYIRKHNVTYIQDQVYLNPHPKELMLRNHV
jgi:uncharacterized protein YbgA (DUF1722 family)/uncharacterized protein YbbK (DUF523 family)